MTFLLKDPFEAAKFVKEGELVAFPTETVYGLGASVFNPIAIQEIFRVKGRPQDNPLIVHISDLEQLEQIVHSIPKEFYQLAEAFFPGPLTILLPKKSCVPDLVSAGLATIGVRMPSHPLARELIRAVGEPLVAPSANLSGKPSSTTAAHVLQDFNGKIGAILDGGACSCGIESTVLRLIPEPQILRPGTIRKEEIEAVLKLEVRESFSEKGIPSSPGMKYRHYAPNAKVVLVESFESSYDKKVLKIKTVSSQTLYASLREADLEGYEEIHILCDETTRLDRALMNRLQKAAE